MSKLFAVKSSRFLLSASVLAIMASGSASAQTTVLTSASPNYDLLANAGVDKTVEVSSGTNAYFLLGDSHASDHSGSPQAAVPAGGVGILSTVGGWWQYAVGHDASGMGNNWILTNTNVPQIKVDSGATLTFAGKETYGWDVPSYAFYSMVQAAGDVTFQSANWTFWGNNNFGNVTLVNTANLQFGGDADQNGWTCCGNAANATISGWLAGASTTKLSVGMGTLTFNGVNTSAHSFAGVVNISASSTLMVGDSTHSGAVFGGTGAKINLTTSSSVLAGYGTVNGTVDSYGIIKAGGVSGVMGTLTINGNLTQHSTGQVYTSLTPTGASGIVVNGNAVIDGELVVSVADGTYGNGVYKILTATNLSGKFSTVSLSGNTSGAILGAMKTDAGYMIVTEKGTSGQVYGHLDYANRMSLTNFVSSLYDVTATAPQTGAKVDFWVTPLAAVENLSRDGLGYDQTTYGLSAGAMHRFERHGGVIGGAFSYRRGDMTVKNDTVTASSNGFDFGIYGGAEVNSVRLDGNVFYNVYTADTARPMGSYGTSKASQSGSAMGFSGQISRELFHGWSMPYVRSMYTRTHLEAASESGSLQYDLAHTAINHNTFVVDVGMRVHLLRPEADQKIKVDADLAWRYDLSDPGETVGLTYANFAGGTNIAYWRGDSKHALRLGVNASGDITDKLELYGRLDGTLTSRRRGGELAAGLKYRL